MLKKIFRLSEQLLHKGIHLLPVMDFASFYESFLTYVKEYLSASDQIPC